MSNTEAIVTEAMNGFAPVLEARYADYITRTFAAIQKALGVELRNVYNDWTWARTFRMSIAPNLVNDRTAINVDRLEANAKEYAAMTIESLKGKIVSKLGTVENVEIKRLTGGTFDIRGTMKGQRFQMEQTIIVKCSSKGLVFNQFPARIYLNGKFISEAAFKKLQSRRLRIRKMTNEAAILKTRLDSTKQEYKSLLREMRAIDKMKTSMVSVDYVFQKREAIARLGG